MGNNPDKGEHWVDDVLVTSCPVCYQPFTALKRRHHCRKCGRIYCGDHLPYKMTLLISGVDKEICKECYFAKPVYYKEPSSDEESEETKRRKDLQCLRIEQRKMQEEAKEKKKEREEEERKAFRMFTKAIDSGNIEAMRDILLEGVIDCNYTDDSGTALSCAMNSLQRIVVLNFLLDYGVNVEKAYNSVKPIHFAILNGDYDTVKLLIEKGKVNLNAHYKFKTTLYLATERNAKHIVQLLLENGAVNDPEALALALKENYLDIAKLCLKWGAKKWPSEHNDIMANLQKELAKEK